MTAKSFPTFDCDNTVVLWQPVFPRRRIRPELGVAWPFPKGARALHDLRALATVVETLDGFEPNRSLATSFLRCWFVRN